MTGSAIEFSPGQAWAYVSRPGEEASMLLVGRVEPHDELGLIVHVQFQDVSVRNAASPNGISSLIAHVPVAERSLREGVCREIRGELDRDAFESGYLVWRASFDAGDGGIFTIPPAKIVDYIEQVLNQ